MKTIFRYALRTQDQQEIETHAGAQFLSVACKPNETTVSLWALVDPTAPRVSRRLRIVGTGHSLMEHPGDPDFAFVGTACADHGVTVLCWHVFVEVAP